MTVRRLKTYTGAQGYVYQYYFVGSRPAVRMRADPSATEYVFDVTSDRKTTFSVSVFLQEDAVENWSSRHHRALPVPTPRKGCAWYPRKTVPARVSRPSARARVPGRLGR